MNCDGKPRPWQREPLVWLLIAIPMSAVIMGIVMITLAIQSFSGLVVDDYYKQGKQINRVIARDRLAYELGLAAGLQLNQNGTVEVRFEPQVDLIPGDDIELALVHATKPGLDQTLQLTRVEYRLLRGELQLRERGRWRLYLQTPDWRLTGALQYPQFTAAELKPNYVTQ